MTLAPRAGVLKVVFGSAIAALAELTTMAQLANERRRGDGQRCELVQYVVCDRQRRTNGCADPREEVGLDRFVRNPAIAAVIAYEWQVWQNLAVHGDS